MFAGLLGSSMVPGDPLPDLRTSVRIGCYTRLRRRLRWDMPTLPLLEAATPDAVARATLQDWRVYRSWLRCVPVSMPPEVEVTRPRRLPWLD